MTKKPSKKTSGGIKGIGQMPKDGECYIVTNQYQDSENGARLVGQEIKKFETTATKKPAKKIKSGTYTLAKKRNQTDLTLRNLRALKKTVVLLAVDIAALDANLILMNDRIERLEKLKAVCR